MVFVRVFYFWVGIFILDDVFSVVDVYVGCLIVDKVLMGELVRGRICIFVIYYVEFVLLYVSFYIQFYNGEVFLVEYFIFFEDSFVLIVLFE